MNVTVIAVGRLSKGEEAALVQRYFRRLRRLKPKTIELAESSIAREGQQIMAKLPMNDLVLALDERGNAPTSLAWAKRIESAADGGRGVTIIVGGPDGLAQTVRDRADDLISFGAMTWPHQLVRVLLAEQLYRAETIMAAHPYHRQ